MYVSALEPERYLISSKVFISFWMWTENVRILWSLISAVGCTIFSNRNKCLVSYTNTLKHISNSNKIKAHACSCFIVQIYRKYHTQFLHNILNETLVVLSLFGQGIFFVIYFTQQNVYNFPQSDKLSPFSLKIFHSCSWMF